MYVINKLFRHQNDFIQSNITLYIFHRIIVVQMLFFIVIIIIVIVFIMFSLLILLLCLAQYDIYQTHGQHKMKHDRVV